MDESRYIKNSFEDYKEQFADQIPNELNSIKNFLETNQYFLPYLNQVNASYPYNDVYVGKYGILLLYYFLNKKSPEKFGQFFHHFYSTCIAKCDKRCDSDISFHCGNAGIYAIESVIQHRIFKSKPNRDKYLVKLSTLVQDAINPTKRNYDELLYGRVSILYALCFVENELKTDVQELETVIQLDNCKRQVVQKILDSGVHGRQNHSQPLLKFHYAWHGKEYCGAAHGYSGIYYLLLKNRAYCSSEQLNDLIESCLLLVQTQLLKNGNMSSRLGGRSNDLVQWCHGSPGFLFLLSELYSLCSNDNQLKKHCPLIQQITETCLNTTWRYGILTKGLNLCHGTAGNAYGFLAWYRQTGDKRSLYRAIQFAKYCLNFNENFMLSDRPLSLYEGLAGTIYFLVDILEPDNSCFPGFEL